MSDYKKFYRTNQQHEVKKASKIISGRRKYKREFWLQAAGNYLYVPIYTV